ncbi:MAG: bi-domain-containing oxidoreductase [Chlorobiota bacterium]
MLQVVQYQKSGEVRTEEMPSPQCPPGGVLIEVKNTLISAGTEKTSVDNAQGSLLTRAKKQPDQVKVVLDAVKSYGIKETARRVNAKLNSFKLLGYSAAGVVIESNCDEFKPGDRVAAAGAGIANHAEIIAVPKNLVVHIADSVSYEDAAYTTVGAIAMQGFRQAAPNLGETVVVVGLGLLGLITVQFLKAAGCNVIGMDIDERAMELGTKFGCDSVMKSSSENVQQVIARSNGEGADSTIITASTGSSAPLQMAMEMTRKRGKVVIVGAIGMDMKRHPFYKKEIELKISSSYGPGRYDAFYEEQGNDYPYAFVRWTENRNMQAFLELIEKKRINIKDMTTHSYNVAEASKAYDLISKGTEPYLGILINYPDRENKKTDFISTGQKSTESDIKIGFVGAGQFAQNYLLPPLAKQGVKFVSVANNSSASSKTVATNFAFEKASANPDELIKDSSINTVMVASWHNTHAKYVLSALKNGKNIYVEKPLALNEEELNQIMEAASKSDKQLMVGFNRRFSKSFKKIKEELKGRKEPLMVKYRVNAGHIPKDHWTQRAEGGGRIIGEGCHFIDTMLYLTDSKPIRVYAESFSGNSEAKLNEDNVAATIKFEDGSVGVLEYISSGDGSLAKEYCEVFFENTAMTMNNFESVTLHKGKKATNYKMDGEKGIKSEMELFVKSLKSGQPLIPQQDLFAVTKCTFAILESLNKSKPITITY